MSTVKLATDGSNWVTYQSRMTWAFNLRGWSDHLTTSTVPAAYTTAGNINGQSPDQRWAIEEAITKHMIAASVPDRIFHQIKSKTSTMEVWATMKAMHQSKTITGRLQEILQSAKLQEAGNARAHFTGLLELREQLAAMGKSWDDNEFTSVLLDSLPPSYRIVINAINAATDITGVSATPDQVIQIVTDEYDRQVIKLNKNSSEKAFATKSQRRREQCRRNAKCYKCHEKGHYQVSCQAKRSRRTERTGQKKPRLANQDCNSTDSRNPNAHGQYNKKNYRHAYDRNENHYDNHNNKSNVASTLDTDAGATTNTIEDDEPAVEVPQAVYISAPFIHEPDVEVPQVVITSPSIHHSTMQIELHDSGVPQHAFPLLPWFIPSRAITVINNIFCYLTGTKIHALMNRNERHNSFRFTVADSTSPEHSCAIPRLTFLIDNVDNSWVSRDHETLTLSTAGTKYFNVMHAAKDRMQFCKSTSTLIDFTLGPTTPDHNNKSALHSSPNSNGYHHTQNAIDIRFHYDHPPAHLFTTNLSDNCNTLGHTYSTIDIRSQPTCQAIINSNSHDDTYIKPCTVHTQNDIRFRSKVSTRQDKRSDITDRCINITFSSPTNTLPTYKVASHSLDLKICHA